MLEIKNIQYSYKKLQIFEGIDFSIEKWVVWILWPSWSWKTTFIKTVWGYIKPLSWGIFLNKKNIRKFILDYRKNNWFHFQDYNLLEIDVKTNLELPFIIWEQKKDEKWLDYLVKYFEIWKLLNKNIENISWWEKERVSLVKAFVNKPHIAFLDEAWAALDERLKNKVFKFIKDYWKENIVFFVSHDKNIQEYFWLQKIIYKWAFNILR